MNRRATYRSVVSFVVLASTSLTPPFVHAQAIDQSLWIGNSRATSIVQSGGTIYVGGAFFEVGPATGCAVPLDATTGAPQGVPGVVGDVFAVAPDGAGGWYIGGEFTHVGGVARSNIAHIQANHTVSAWNPSAGALVRSLAVDGGVVYAGGEFTSIGGQPRNRIAALNATTGLALAWNPNASASVLELIAAEGGIVYAAGTFTTIGGQTRNRIAALDSTTGLATAWNPNADGAVNALAVDGSTVFAGGTFLNIGGTARNFVAALDGTTGLVTAWYPSLGSNGQVDDLVVSGGVVYAAGVFTTIGLQPRNRAAALDLGTGAPTAWNPDVNSWVKTIAVDAGVVYMGGNFTAIGGQARSRIGAVDEVTAIPTAWDPHAGSDVEDIVAAGGTVYVGGQFESMGGVTRYGVAAFDAATGAATAWDPEVSPPAVEVIALSGDTLFVGGAFTSVGGQPRNGLAAIDVNSGAVLGWNPNPNGAVMDMKIGGGKLYVAGTFTTIGGQARNRLAAIDLVTAAATAWNPNPNGIVNVLALSGALVYAGGEFTIIGGQSRNRIAAVDGAVGSAISWNPNASGSVISLVVSGSTVYAGGLFTSIGGLTRQRIAAIDAFSGAVTSWNPVANVSVVGMAVSGGVVYACGAFTSIGGQSRSGVAALSATTGQAFAWNPNPSRVGFSGGGVQRFGLGEREVYVGGLFDAFGGKPRRGLAAITHVPVLTHIATARGGDTGTTTASAVGHHILPGATVKLTKAAQPDITGLYPAATPDDQSVVATYPLAGATHGTWNVVVTNPDLQTATLANAFTVETTAPYEVRIGIIGPEQIRPDRSRGFALVLENRGNTDAVGLPLWISGIPSDGTLELGFEVASPPQAGGEPDWSAAPLTFDGPSGRYAALVIPRLAPGTTVLPLRVAVPNTVATFDLAAALAPPWADSEGLRACLSAGGVITDSPCVGAELTAFEAHMAGTGAQAINGIGLWAKVAWQCEGAGSLPAALTKAQDILDFIGQPVEGTGVPAHGEVAFVPRWQDRKRVTKVMSLDPNEKLGPGGVGPARLIASDQLLPYSIRFENLESATAPAQEVVVVDALDPTTLDKNTVSIGPITLPDRTVYPPPGLRAYATTVDLRPEKDLLLQIGVNLDLATGVLNWGLSSLDAATGVAPEDPGAGFLPPNLAPPEGEGGIMLTVMPKSGLAGGTEIGNAATILFDGSPLPTAEWVNQVDGAAPESAVLPLPATIDSLVFTVRWEAAGSPADLHDYSVYVSDNGGAYRAWRAHTTATADTFSGPQGHTFAFYSLARDSSGNLEAVPGSPDAQTTIPVGVEGERTWSLALEGAIPHPVAGRALVWFTLPNANASALEVVDVAGRRVLRREVGSLGPGRHALDVSEATRRPGLYFVRLRQAGRSLTSRMVVIR